jgi:hypothetical protein
MVFIDNGFTFIINKFHTEVYYSSDVMSKAEIKRTHKIIYQNLLWTNLTIK